MLTNEQLKSRYPGLAGLPSDFHGFFAHKAGIVRAAVGLQATKKLALEQKADLRFNTPVQSVDVKAATVTLPCGKIFRGKHIVVACGPFSD
jgi:L-2-hydroxyglutarate oxidase LhgO